MPIDSFSVSCAQLTRDLLAIANFLLCFILFFFLVKGIMSGMFLWSLSLILLVMRCHVHSFIGHGHVDN